MSVKSFVESAIILHENNKYNEALCLVCIAIDACSAKRYPDRKVSERYKLFLHEHFRTICRYGFPGIEAANIRIKVNTQIESLKTDTYGYIDMEQIIYHTLRCGLVHTCTIEETVQFTEATIIGSFNSDTFYIPKMIIWGLIESIQEEIRET